MYSVKDLWFFTIGVSPFGNPRVKGYFHLSVAYRRLSRPSSALSAKAFTLRSFSLEQPFCLFSWIFLNPNKFSFFCLSFANNCLGCKLKDLLVLLIHCCLSPSDYYLNSTKLFWSYYFSNYSYTLYLYGKTF